MMAGKHSEKAAYGKSNKERTRANSVSSTPMVTRSVASNESASVSQQLQSPQIPTPQIEKLLKELELHLMGKLDERFEIIETKLREMDERSQLLEGKIMDMVNNAVGPLKSCIAVLEQKCDDLEHKLESLASRNEDLLRVQRLADAVITGIPVKQGEDPIKLMKSISSVVNHNLSQHANAFRISTRNRNRELGETKKVSHAPIMVKFSSINEQHAFISSFKRHGGVKLRQIEGFSSDSSIYVSESLTPKNQSLLRAALRSRKLGSLHSVFTRNGFVYTKQSLDDQPTRADMQVRGQRCTGESSTTVGAIGVNG